MDSEPAASLPHTLFLSPPGGYPGVANVGMEIVIDAVAKGGRVPYDAIRADLLLCRTIHPDLLNKIANLDAMDFFCAGSVFPRFSSAARSRRRDRYLEANGLSEGERGLVRGALSVFERHFTRYLRRTRPKVLALSVNSERFLTALHYVKVAREILPDLEVVMGGSALQGDVGISFFDAFPEVDYLVYGRGEHVGKELLECIHAGRSTESLEGMLLSRRDGAIVRHAGGPEPGPYPLPEMDAYYQELVDLTQRHGRDAFGELYGIAVPLSAGCWWGKCDFCSEPSYHDRYRLESADIVAKYIGRIASKHHLSDVLFLDSIQPPPAYLKKLCDLLGRDPVRYRMSGEIHAKIPDETLDMLADAGYRTVQVGIETYSQSLLDRMNKGTKLIDILRILTMCAERGIAVQGNVLMHHPLESREDVRATARVMDLTSHLFSPTMQHYFVAHGSPLARTLRQSGTRTHALLRHWFLYPASVRSRLTFSYRYLPENRTTYGLWRSLKRKQATMRAAAPRLAYYDGRDSIQIIDTRDPKRRSYWFDRHDRDLLVTCARPRRIDDILSRLPGIDAAATSERLNRLVDAKIMFRQDDRYLTLAIPWSN